MTQNPQPDSESYGISQLSSEFAITPRTIRFYEEKGLLTPTRDGQTRVYSHRDRTKLKLILRGKRLGLSLEESREIIDLYDPRGDNRKQLLTLIDKIHQRRLALEQQRQDIELTLSELDQAEQRAQQALRCPTLI